MTRINVGIPPSELCDKHLLAELREITRIPNTIRSGKAKVKDIPEQFTLGKGHVKFFYNKILYLKHRYNKLYNESTNRGFNVTDKSDSFNDIPPILNNDYIETQRDIDLIEERIKERKASMKSIKMTSGYIPNLYQP